MPWNREYRPRQFSQLHLASVRETLLSLLSAPTLPQVFIFAGPKGTGKTSSARILAAVLNDEKNTQAVKQRLFEKKKNPVAFQEPSLDDASLSEIFDGKSYLLNEIDAASHRGIDDIRSLKERVYIPPQFGTVCVYILDEAHMLTTEASNALLKILEEPPAHAVFILATTQEESLLPTIRSRAFIVPFHTAQQTELQQSLNTIVKKEKLDISPDALDKVVELSEGSFRDAVKLLEQVAQGPQPITLESVQKLLPVPQTRSIVDLFAAVVDKHPGTVVSIIAGWRSSDLHEKKTIKSCLSYLHTQLTESILSNTFQPDLDPKVSRFLLKALLDPVVTTPAPIAFVGLEIQLLELIARSQQKSGTSPTISPTPTPTPSKPKSAALPPVTQEAERPKQAVATQPQVEQPAAQPVSTIPPETVLSSWPAIIEQVNKDNVSLAAILQSAQPEADKERLAIGVFYSFHASQLKQSKNTQLLEKAIQHVCAGVVPFEFKTLTAKPTSPDASQDLTQMAASALL